MQRLSAGPIDLRIRFQPKQSQFWRYVSDSRRGCPTKIGYGGARGGGKSKAGRDVMILLCLTFAGIDAIIIRRKWKDVYRNHVVPMFREFPALRQWWNESKKTLQFPNGSKLVFGYAEHKDDVYDFQGQEYAFILVEEATHFCEEELRFLETCNRWTQNPVIVPKMLYTTNPGNVGHDFIKRVFVLRDFTLNEDPDDYVFIQAYGWDNVEWAISAFLQDLNVTAEQWITLTREQRRLMLAASIAEYYASTDEERFQFFVTRTDYGKKLNALPGQERDAHLFGSWDSFVGQFFSEFNRKIHVVKPFPIPSYWERFSSFDWGFTSPACTLWFAVSPQKQVFAYREAYVTKRDSTWLAKNNVRMTGTEKLRYNVCDPACSNPNHGPSTTEVMGLAGWHMIDGDNERVNGWARVREYLAWEIDPKTGILTRPPALQIFDVDSSMPGYGCPHLIRTLPAQIHDEYDPEDIDTNGEDHAPDTLRYGLMTRPRVSVVPIEVMPDEYAEATRRADHHERGRA